jgi:hypothetical protein
MNAPDPAIGFEIKRVRAAAAVAMFSSDRIDQSELRRRLYALGYTEPMVKAEIDQHSCVGRPLARPVKL